MSGCLDEQDIKNIKIALDEYKIAVISMIDDEATSELAGKIVENIEESKAKLPGLACVIR